MEDLEKCSGLILPGGETTAHLKLLKNDFWKALVEFGHVKPIFGTCCGLILLSSKIVGSPVPTLELMDLTTERNAYGTQLDSFEDEINAELDGQTVLVKGCFIRAPKILEIGPGVKVLATHFQNPVIVEQGLHLACTFHPEISMDTSLHAYFADRCREAFQVT
ncbi:MAG: Pyridoxal 5'-phosphate synthase subunit PdxT [Chlamydiae bacterium]|nr:Pyridoxal 5'-phosphate synthase subunit PdxT [Chlamydiota bacterium]